MISTKERMLTCAIDMPLTVKTTFHGTSAKNHVET